MDPAELDPTTPVLIGVGQVAERVDDVDYRAMSAVELAAAAACEALKDTCVDVDRVGGSIGVVAGVRQLEISLPGMPSPLGRSDNFPRSVAKRLGLTPQRAVLETVGGQSPQHLVNEFAGRIASGETDAVLLVGAEAISTTRRFAAAEERPDFNERIDGDLEDRGYGLKGLISREMIDHGLTGAPEQYALFENARRARLGYSRERYVEAMGELFAPFTQVAAKNPLAAAPVERDAQELVTLTDSNRVIADPYPRYLVARDQVNQGAAVVMTSVATARKLGAPAESWVFLHGHADLQERDLLERQDLSQAPASVMAARHALEVAGRSLDEMLTLDFYSCFPIAVFATAIDGLGLAAGDPRGLTVTGGLPFFGGAGNNYSMHAITETVKRLRAAPGSFGFVGANGGSLSKYSVGIYSTTPTPWRSDDSAALQAEIDGWPAPSHVTRADGWGTIESYTIKHGKGDRRTGIVVGRLEAGGERFLATVDSDDEDMLALLASAEPIGQRIFAKATPQATRVTLDDTRMFRRYPTRRRAFRDDYEHILVHRDGHLLEVTINRPRQRNALTPPANDELAEVFDAYFAESDLWAAILTGAGDTAFCAGNDLLWSASGRPMWVPDSGFAGLTSRADMTKPVIAAVNGYAMGGGLEVALACHVVVADSTASFALSEARVGLIAGAGGLVRLPRSVPPKVANDMILSGRRLSAGEALDYGLVSRLAPAGEALAVARDLAREVIAASPTSVRLSLQLINEAQRIADPVSAVRRPSEAIDELLFSEDMHEGLAAFAQKRPPMWKNR